MKVCFLIPAFNEAKTIRRAIWSACLAGAHSDDIYVIDDGSTDDTAAKARGMHAEVLSITNSGKARALKAGLDHFKLLERYDWIGILDADSALKDNYLRAMREGAEKFPKAVVLCGAPRSARHNWLTAYRAVEYAMSLGIYREAQHLFGTINVAPGCASLYKSSVLRTLSLSGDTLVEDMDLTIQVQRRGLSIAFIPEARVITQDPRTLRSYIGQVDRWYRGTWQIVRKHRLMRHRKLIDLEMGSLLLEGLLFVVLLAALPLLTWWSPFTVGLVFGFDQLMFLVFTILVAVRERRADVLWAFPTFTIPRLASAIVFANAFLTTRRPSRNVAWYSVARY